MPPVDSELAGSCGPGFRVSALIEGAFLFSNSMLKTLSKRLALQLVNFDFQNPFGAMPFKV
jgi:hypothetical protein